MTSIHDAAQQESVYIEYYSKVLGYVSNRVHNRNDAEDIAANVFLKVYKNISSFDSEKSSLSTWIYTITRNTLIDYFKKTHISSPLSETEASPDNVEESFLREELLQTLAVALEGLDVRERDIVILHYYKQKTLTEIASLMLLSYSYVKILHKKAINELKAAIG